MPAHHPSRRTLLGGFLAGLTAPLARGKSRACEAAAEPTTCGPMPLVTRSTSYTYDSQGRLVLVREEVFVPEDDPRVALPERPQWRGSDPDGRTTTYTYSV